MTVARTEGTRHELGASFSCVGGLLLIRSVGNSSSYIASIVWDFGYSLNGEITLTFALVKREADGNQKSLHYMLMKHYLAVSGSRCILDGAKATALVESLSRDEARADK